MNLPELLLTAILDHVRNGDRVIDVGSGLEAPYQLGLQKRAKHLVMLDAHQPYLDANRCTGPNVHKVCGVTPSALFDILDRAYDVAVCCDHVEHLSKANGRILIRQLQRIADTVILYTPDGMEVQAEDHYGMGAEQWQTHRSGWTLPELMDEYGFQIGHHFQVLDGPGATAILAVWKRPLTKGRLLIVGEFDPAGVGLGHRDALRRQGWDARVASEFVYTQRQADADWYTLRWSFDGGGRWHPQMFDRDALFAFAEECDVIQVCPGLAQPWADSPEVFLPVERRDAPASPRFDVVDWTVLAPKAARVAYFHGSVTAWVNRALYREWYTGRGYTLAASTLDYACDLPAVYLPPVQDPVWPVASFRDDRHDLMVVHCPTNPAVNHTAEIKDACGRTGVSLRIHHRMPHEVVMRAKALAHVGFDHLRGSFSVNTLENAAARLVTLVGMEPRYAERLAVEGFKPLPQVLSHPLVTPADLAVALAMLKDDPSLTRRLQAECWAWAEQFESGRIGARLNAFYSHLLEDR